VLPALLAPVVANGQQTVLALEFSFSNPGARSLGLAGAFAGLADDATAAFANPAGLVQLLEPEISVEGRRWRYSTPYTKGGRLFGEPTGIGLDSTPGLRIAESSQELSGLSFLSFVYPKKRWSLAVYRHQLADFEFFGETQGLFRGVPEGGPDARERFPDERSFTNFEILSHGLSVARRITDRFSLGVGITHFEGELFAISEAYTPPNIADPNFFPPEALLATSVLAIDSTDWGFNAGLLWKIDERWHVGGFFREGADFELAIEVRSGAPDPQTLGVALTPIEMPDVYGLGFSFRSLGGAWTVGLEWDRVEYNTIVGSIDPSLEITATLDDGDELHLGAEYVLVRSAPLVALRAGAWLDPDHRLRAEEGTSLITRALRQPGDDEVHFSVGVGVAFQRFQLDFGLDLSELVDTASLSTIYSF
jgi:hypothetical protein